MCVWVKSRIILATDTRTINKTDDTSFDQSLWLQCYVKMETSKSSASSVPLTLTWQCRSSKMTAVGSEAHPGVGPSACTGSRDFNSGRASYVLFLLLFQNMKIKEPQCPVWTVCRWLWKVSVPTPPVFLIRCPFRSVLYKEKQLLEVTRPPFFPFSTNHRPELSSSYLRRRRLVVLKLGVLD